MTTPRLYIGPMSQNVTNAVIEYANETSTPLGLIPSRRQVDYMGGYVCNWTTAAFSKYVREKTPWITIVRDHGGPEQGTGSDPGYDSLCEDSRANLNILHLDPWKLGLESGPELTARYLRFCHDLNPETHYEVGTEEAICPYQAEQLDSLLGYLKSNLTAKQYERIVYGVIQSGTSIKNAENTGAYDQQRLQDMIQVCKKNSLLSKEHNGDYLTTDLIHEKFALGLDSINIAPEFGQIETSIVLDLLRDKPESIDLFYKLCWESGRWKKWISSEATHEMIIGVSGHYVFSNPGFQAIRDLLPELDSLAKLKMKQRIREIVGVA